MEEAGVRLVFITGQPKVWKKLVFGWSSSQGNQSMEEAGVRLVFILPLEEWNFRATESMEEAGVGWSSSQGNQSMEEAGVRLVFILPLEEWNFRATESMEEAGVRLVFITGQPKY
eukprot:CAMPEP_0113618474 /NCGR_PEP_ID=MMETSP0017_2-20120614/9356_1 /TAXON_ID=2856 /ORGANISM="Cylindrotheca closterium" /LENGTH=114 /DNA_ID=CAMNT_0000527985 /DNA_START=758 /DNA_END=1100 /DNA_ORIENTATION=- /assembly_acc=CAM_ASM_000147